MIEFFHKLFSSDFMPHGFCYLWNPAVLWLNVGSDAVIAASYYAIPVLLFSFARKRRDLSFQWVFVAFAMFILACGTTHLLGVWTVWHGTYRLDGLVKAVTAAVSLITAVSLVPFLPKVLALPSPAQLSAANEALTREVGQRTAVEEQIRQLNSELESRVVERTADLERTNADLQAEIKRREEAEDRLVQAQKMEAIGRLAGGIAHDFNNVLTVLLGSTSALDHLIAPDHPARRMVAEAQRATEQAALVTGQLLAFSRKQATRPQSIDLNAFIRGSQEVLQRLVGEDVEVAVKLEEPLGSIEADEAQLSQVLMNLVVNARDAMPAGGHLTIETRMAVREEEDFGSHGVRPAGRYLMLIVSDTGLGMDLATQARVFEPFFTTKEVGKGTGLGLATVYGIVQGHGGWIDVYSEPGHGSAFRLYFPESAAAQEKRVTPPPVTTGRTGTILLVEDQAAILMLGEEELQEAGHEVLTASNGAAALKVAAAYPGTIDLLVTDVVMPGMSGPELAAHLERARPGLAVLYTSGYTDHALFQRGVVEEGTAFLPKPYQPSALVGKVAEMLSESGSERAAGA